MLRVIKVGGSLLDWPELTLALHHWLEQQTLAINVLICGGGQLADCIREADQRFALGDQRAHWLAVDCMTITARLLSQACRFESVLNRYDDVLAIRDSQVPQSIVLDVRDFLLNVEPTLPGTPLPHDWTATSDSIAARLAETLPADELVLLKSTDVPSTSLAELATAGYIDRHFPLAATQISPPRFINLRAS